MAGAFSRPLQGLRAGAGRRRAAGGRRAAQRLRRRPSARPQAAALAAYLRASVAAWTPRASRRFANATLPFPPPDALLQRRAMRQPQHHDPPAGPPPLLSRPVDVNTSGRRLRARRRQRGGTRRAGQGVRPRRRRPAEGRFHVSGRGAHRDGRPGEVTGAIRQTCVVTLEEFASEVDRAGRSQVLRGRA